MTRLATIPTIPGAPCENCPQHCQAGPTLRVVLIGQPNCGKSTLFNSVAGYRSATGNFAGTTAQLTWSRVRVNGSELELIDAPGIYSLAASSPAESAATQFLLTAGVDVIVNVVDASLLSRSLELTVALRDLGIPMVVCLNMMDEAEHKGLTISPQKLSELLRVPVVETVANRGVGVRKLFGEVLHQGKQQPESSDALRCRPDVEGAVDRLETFLGESHLPSTLPRRFLAVRLLEGDPDLSAQLTPQALQLVETLRKDLEQRHGWPAQRILHAERHDRAMHLFEQSTAVGRPRADFRVMLDALLTHPLWGYVCLLVLLGGMFWGVFGFGGWLERSLLTWLDAAFQPISARLDHQTVAFALVRGLWQGIAGGAAIVLPYLTPFLFALALLEDVGYLPRIAYLLDGLLHRIGLHGTSVVPIMLGYGCSVPACLATRILPSRRDRFLAALLSSLVPCSARSTVIFALVAFYLGPGWAFGIFACNALIVFLSGWLLTRLWPEVSAGMIMEVPRYQWPSLRSTTRKVWLRLREFVVVSWPLLVGGSMLLGLAEFAQWDRLINAGLSPLTAMLGLPPALGVTLIFGVLRKELSMVMLVQALGTTDIHAVMSAAQIVTFTVFITFYIPCLATLAAMAKEIGIRLTMLAAAYSLALAALLGVASRFLLEAARV